VKSRVVIDLETCSLGELPLMGAHAYAYHPSTQVTVLCYAINDEPVHTWTGGPCPADLCYAIGMGATVVAHNYLFELNVWAAKLVPLGFPPIGDDQWSCTMARSLAMGLPGALEKIGPLLNLSVTKDKTAHGLMIRFSKPRDITPEGYPVWWHETDPGRFKDLCVYCARDVGAERELDRTVPELDPREAEIFSIDREINQRGIPVNTTLAITMRGLAEDAKAKVNAELVRLTNGQIRTTQQVTKLVAWIEGQGVTVPTVERDGEDRPTLDREHVEAMLASQTLPLHVERALRCRRDVSRSSTAKLDTLLGSADRDHRLRGTTQYYGANRTGRWAGRRFQPQNLPRGTIKAIPEAVNLIEHGAQVEDLDLLFEDSAMGVLASSLRSVIEAAPGKLLVSCDLSQIEARVLLWVAGQTDMLNVFRHADQTRDPLDDIYNYTARKIGSTNRQLGKVLVLACGFGMGPTRFQKTALSYGVVLDELEARNSVDAWRKLNSRVVNFWWEAHRAALRVVSSPPGHGESFGPITFNRGHRTLRVHLPSQRALVYWNPQVTYHSEHGHPELTYSGTEPDEKYRLRSWPGKLTENIVQAIARDVMAESMIAAHAKGVPIITTVHDELVAEIEEARAPALKDWLSWAMNRSVPWAPGLPVAAVASVGKRYRKD
jgi:DNA polymerase